MTEQSVLVYFLSQSVPLVDPWAVRTCDKSLGLIGLALNVCLGCAHIAEDNLYQQLGARSGSNATDGGGDILVSPLLCHVLQVKYNTCRSPMKYRKSCCYFCCLRGKTLPDLYAASLCTFISKAFADPHLACLDFPFFHCLVLRPRHQVQSSWLQATAKNSCCVDDGRLLVAGWLSEKYTHPYSRQ